MSNNRPRDMAVAYAHAILGRSINFKLDAWLIKQATALCKAVDELGATDKDALLLLIALHTGQSELTGYVPWNQWAAKRGISTPVSMNNLLYVKPEGRNDVSLLQAALTLPDPPPMHDLHGWVRWVEQYGKRAIERGKWQGIFPYAVWRDPKACEMPPEKLGGLIGTEYVELSLEHLKEVESKLCPISSTIPQLNARSAPSFLEIPTALLTS